MPKSLQLNIPEPCHENWQQMTPQEQGRFCGSCQKTVVDFSIMSDQEVLNYFSKASYNVCGRFANDQLNRELVITEKKKRFSWAYVWNVLLATFLLTEANAQVKPKAKPKKPVKTFVRQYEVMGDVAPMRLDPEDAVIPVTIKGKVIDSTNNQPVIGVSISIKNKSGGTMTDTLGNFHFSVQKKDSLVLEFSAIGYETQTRVIDALTNWQNVQVFLKPAFTGLEEVTVISYPVIGKIKRLTTGPVIITKESVVTLDSIKNYFWNCWAPTGAKKEIKIYPNPVMRGNAVKVSVALKQAGDYKLEVLNTAGQVLQIMPLLFQTKEQQIDVHTDSNWSAGIYWIRISAIGAENFYQGKFLLQ